MNLKIFTFLILLIYSNNSQASNTDQLKTALYFSYNFEFERSDSCLNDYITNYPDEAEGYIYTAQNHLWKYMGSKEPGELGVFWRYSDLGKMKFTDDEPSQFKRFFEGWNYLLRSIAYSSNDEMFDAFSNAKSAYNIFDDLIDENPRFYDAYLGRGLIKYSLSYTPGVFQWILSLLGLDADKESGFADVKAAFENAQIVSPEAGFHYARFLREYYADYQMAESILDKLAESFPQNLLYLYQSAVSKIKLKKFEAAESILNKIVDSNDRNFPRTVDFAYFLLGECGYLQLKFSEAKKNYYEFIQRARAIDFTGFANLRLAYSEAFLGNADGSLKRLMLTGLGNTEMEKDELSAQLTSKYFQKGIPQTFLRIEKANLLVELEKVDQARILLESSELNLEDDEQRLKVKFILASSYFFEGKYSEALRLIDKDDPADFSNETQYRTLFYLLQAKCHAELSNRSKALHFIELAEDANDGLFQAENKGLINKFRKKMDEIVQKASE